MLLSDGKEYPMALAIRGLEVIASREAEKIRPFFEAIPALLEAVPTPLYLLLEEKLLIAANMACLVMLADTDPEDLRLREEVMTLFYRAAHRKMAELLEDAGCEKMAGQIMETLEGEGSDWGVPDAG